MKFWWVNHKQTYSQETSGGYLWSPKLMTNGNRSHFYDNMTQVEPGDIVFSYSDTHIRQVGVARSRAQTSPKPAEFGQKGKYWHDEGWLVEVDFAPLSAPLRPKDQMAVLGPVLPNSYSPIQANGSGNQGAYLSAVEGEFLAALLTLLGADFDHALSMAGGSLAGDSEAAELEEQRLVQRKDISVVQVHQLVKARRGQGIFKSNVRLFEKSCRVTRLDIQQHLIASHIKPWAESDDSEKIDGANGLLLSPHVDHLFDRGYISFENTGQLITSRELQYRVLQAWHIDPDTNVGSFTDAQRKYLEYHRDVKLLNAS